VDLIGLNSSGQVVIDARGLGVVFGGSVTLPALVSLSVVTLTVTSALVVTGSAAFSFVSVGTNPANEGIGRFGNNTFLQWRNAANGANIPFGGVDSSNQIIIGLNGTSQATAIVFNEDGADMDLRVESDTNDNHIVSNSGQNFGVGAIGLGRAPSDAALNDHSVFGYLGNVALTASANFNFFKYYIVDSGTVTIPAGTAPIASTLNIDPTTLSIIGAVTDAYTLRIAGAMAGGTRNGALWVVGGDNRLDGGITIGIATALVSSRVAMNNGAGAGLGTLTNAPAAGNPTKWVPINDNGTTRYIPAW